MENRNKIINAILLLVIFMLGWFGNDLYRGITDKNLYEGLLLRNYNETDAEKIAYQKDGLGNWVCVNIKGMDYKRAINTCEHEVGHEIFANECERNISRCMEVVEK